jgi:hypothetical protein
MRRLYCVVILATLLPLQAALAQGTKEPSNPPRPYVIQQGPLPSNTTPPTPNRSQPNIFYPGAPAPIVRPNYRRGIDRY